MSRNTITKRIFGLLSLVIVAGIVMVPSMAHASVAGSLLTGIADNFGDFVLLALAHLSYWILTVASWVLTVCRTLLNASINLTLHIKDLLVVMPAVYTTWQVIRDISSMFFIFMLLYAGITMILNIEKQSFGALIKNLVIAGVLINFSFFFVGLMIDASNIISLQFYRAIAPGKSINWTDGGFGNVVSAAFNDGGISNVFMQALQPQTIYENKGQLSSGHDVNAQMLIAGVGGTIIMIFAALSFIFATLAFAYRTGMLLILLAFSPLWMAGMVVPRIKSEFTDKWWAQLEANLLFMPVYLLLTYIALRIMLGDHPPETSIAHTLGITAGNNHSDGVLGPAYFGMILNYVIAIILINLPLMAAVKIGGAGVGMADKLTKQFTGFAQKQLQKQSANAWHNTGGRAMSKLAENESFKTFAANSKIGEIALKTSRAGGAGYTEKLNKQVEARTKFADSLGPDKRDINNTERQLAGLRANLRGMPAGPSAARTALEQQIRDTEERLIQVRGGEDRKQAFAQRTNTGSTETVFTKVARKDKLAAAKTQIPILEGRVKRHNDRAAQVRTDITAVEGQIENSETQIDNIQTKAQQANRGLTQNETNRIAAIRTTIGNNQNRLASLNAEQAELQNRQPGIDALEEQVRAFREMT